MKELQKKYLLTAIIPMYNSAKYVSHTFETIIESFGKYKDQIQIILVDDGSTDKTKSIAQEFCSKYSNSKLIFQKHKGVSAARNLGIHSADGEYVTFIDSDDEITSQFREVVKKLKSQKYDIVITNMLQIFSRLNLSMEDRIETFRIINHKAGGESPWAKFYKKDFLIDHNLLFNTNLIIGEDALFLYKALTVSQSIDINKIKYYQQCDPHTIGKFKSKMLTSELMFIKELINLFNSYKDIDGYEEVISIENRYKLKEFYRLIENYFTPLYIQGKKSFSEVKQQVKDIAKLWNIRGALSKNPYSKLYWHKRQNLWGFFIKTNSFNLLIKSAIFFKKVNKY